MKDYSDHVCVIGAGTIGNHIAIELLNRGHKVLVIEAGGMDSETNLLGHKDYYFKTPSMLPKNVHRVGGGGNYWIGRIGEFLTKDFLPLVGIREESWLLEKRDLVPYYRSVYKKLGHEGLLDNEFVSEYFAELNLTPPGLGIRPIRYTEPDLLRNSFVSALTHPSLDFLEKTLVTKIKKSNQSQRNLVIAQCIEGEEKEIAVKTVIIAGGALQSAKLFLNSSDLQNDYNRDFAGYFLMEHLDGFIGDIRISRRNNSFLKSVVLDSNRKISNRPEHDCGLSLMLGSLEKEDSVHLSVGFEIVKKVVDYKFAPEVNGLDSIPRNSLKEIAYLAERIAYKLFGTIEKVVRRSLFGSDIYSIWLKAEEIPFRDSRVIVGSKENELIYNHEISAKTSAAVRRSLLRFREIVREQNLGKVDYYKEVLDPSKILTLRPNWHPMGTLRMGKPYQSVVDANLKIHGVDDVFVLSSAVFPTGSNQNPVFTTLALGTRLADHLTKNHE
jgi:hypothetical protein